jgi:hypothetical protein
VGRVGAWASFANEHRALIVLREGFSLLVGPEGINVQGGRVRLGYRKTLALAVAAGCGLCVLAYARELGAREARERIAQALGLDKAGRVHVKSISATGNDAVVEATVDTAFLLSNDKKDGWTVTQVRTGDRQWESIDLIRTAVRKEKILRTGAVLSALGTALEAYRREHGPYVEASTGAGLIDKLYPQYLASAMRLDAWSNEFYYHGGGSSYRLWSSGPDGKSGTPDDLVMENGKMVEGAADQP